MCGWIVVIGRHGQTLPPHQLSRATQALVHRGPDDIGDFFAPGAAMGFRRLAIIDRSSSGHQPMSSEDGELTIVFNGEIYNYRELRRELEAAGQRFRSASDTEVLLAAYRQWGEDCVQRFNGMFAFLIHNRRDGSFFGARDRLGVKPLYHWQDKDWVVFASEPGAIGATGLCTLEPDWERWARGQLWELMDDGEGSCLRDVRQIGAAQHVHVARDGSMRLQRYWQAPAASDAADETDASWVERLGELVSDAVRLRLRSDVPVGFTLSGGIDSSLLVCEAAHQGMDNLVAFSYQDEQYDERQPIADTVARTGARLITLDGSQLDVAALLPAVLAANGEPVHSLSAVANYALFGLARQHQVPVLLGGQGADEVFAGYDSFQHNRWHDLWVGRQWRELFADVRASAALHGHGVAGPLLDTAQHALRAGLGRSGAYAALRGGWQRLTQRPAAASSSVFAPSVLRPRRQPPLLEPGGLALASAQRRALTTTPLPMYLRIEDRVSMAHSVEARLPFTDYRIVEHALRMPDRLRFTRGVNKLALRLAAARRVPESVSSRVRKFGFPVGHTPRTAAGLQRLCRDLAATRAFREREVYEPAGVAALLARAPAVADIRALFQLAQTELWASSLDAARGVAGPSR